MKRSLTGILFLLVLAVAGGIGFFAAEQLREGRVLPAVSTETADTEATAEEAAPDEAATGEADVPAGPEPGAQPVEFGFLRLEIDTTQSTPEACLVFTEALDDTGETLYEDFLEVSPETQPGLRVNGSLLCIQGLGYGENLQVTLRPGLPAASGATLAWAETVPVSLRDRPSALSFGGGIILPRGLNRGVPVTSVNVPAAEIQIFRVGDRLLSQINPSLLDAREIYPYEASDIEFDKGALVWEGTMEIAGRPNADTVTLFPIREALPERQPGVYLLTAKAASADEGESDPYNYTPKASTWLIESDIGLTSFTGEEGLTVFARGLGNAVPTDGLRLRLLARNNEILSEVKTDGSGMAQFAPGLLRGHGGLEPVAVFAYGARGDFNYLDLRRPAFDLTDRGVGGRSAPGPIDAYLYTERGVYRPGETVELVSMLRDHRADAIADVPLTLIVTRPDGVEYRRFQDADQSAGSAHFSIELTRSAPPGRWQARAYIDTDAAPVGRVGFDVQDFVPERLKVALTPQAEVLVPGGPVELDVDAQFLYGAPAAGLEGEGELRLLVDNDPYPEEPGYRFGLIEELFSPKLMGLAVDRTGPDGRARVTGTLEEFGQTTKPLKAEITVGLFEPGGRMTRERTTLKVRTQPLMIGVRPAFQGYSVRQNTEAGFDVIALDGEGARQARTGFSWEIVKEIRHYQWYEVNGAWRYETVTRDRAVAAGSVDVGLEAPARIAETLDWGTYRLAVRDAASGAATSTRFYVGWSGEDADRPDRVSVTAEKDTYRPGETALIEITPPTAGKALIVAAGQSIHHSALIDVPETGARVFVPVTADWGPGAYVMVTTYRPLEEGPAEAPVRAIGLTWIAVDQSDRTLDVSFTLPEIARPQQTLRVPVQVSGVEAGSEAFLTVAAVDEGILQLTDFKSPSPAAYYYRKRRLGLEMRDDYGRLIRPQEGAQGPIRSGGDGAGGEGLTVVPQRTVALFSGIVKLGAGGRATVPLDLPDYAGELRLMAVAFSRTRLGQNERPLVVRDAVVGEVVLPRFLAPSDRADLTLTVHNVEGDAGDYEATLSADGKVSLGEGVRLQMSLAEGERREISLPLEGLEPGLGEVRLSLTGPRAFQSARQWDIEVRPAQRPVTLSKTEVLNPEESLTLEAGLLDSYLAGTASVDVVIGSTPGYDVPGLLRALDRYPYGCLEQTVSRAFPLLYFAGMAQQVGVAEDEGIEPRLQAAIDRVLDMQTPTGGFTMWGWGDREAAHWLSLYAVHFLIEANAREDLIVPQTALRRALGFAGEIANQSWRKAPQRAYAFYVLARSGRASAGDLRYFHDTERQNLKDGMSLGLLGAALAQVGDVSRATGTFEAATALIAAATEDDYAPLPYGSLLRDVAGLTALAAESGQIGYLPALLEKSQALSTAYTNTQEKAWMLFAARALMTAQGEIDVAVAGAQADRSADPFVVSPTEQELQGDVEITNTGDKPIWRTVTVQGVPKENLPAEANGVTLKKTVWTLAGATPSLGAVKQSDRLLILLSGRMPDNDYREMAVMDLLPAGFEIEAVVQGDAKGRSSYGFLPALTRTRSVQNRHDRFVAAFDIGQRSRRAPKDGETPPKPSFNLAYVVRAITPGSFAMPPAYVEDMYAPAVRARTAVRELTIKPAGE